MLKDTKFYDAASSRYSESRYPPFARTYTQFFFKKRLSLAIDSIEQLIGGSRKELSVLEIGCADGVVLKKIYATFKDNFSYFLGIDLSPQMINVAVKENKNSNIVFRNREGFHETKKHDLIVEVGVLNYVASIESEFAYVSSILKNDGWYICSLAGTNSILNRIKPSENGYNNFLSYYQYEQILTGYFTIENKIPVGLFIPLLWRFPFVARTIQIVAEVILRPIIPNLFHEKIYILKRK